MSRKAFLPRGLRGMLPLAATAMLAGCATTMGSGATRVYCGAAAPIRWSLSDTDETIRQAKAANAVGRRLCGWR